MKLILTVFFMLSTADLTAAQKMNILIEPFRNNGNPEYSWISPGMTETVVADFSSINDFKVISREERERALEELDLSQTGIIKTDDVAKVGNFLGAHIILSGSYTVFSDKIRIVAMLTNVETGQTEKSVKLDGNLRNIFDVQDRIVIGLINETQNIRIKGVKEIKIDKKQVKDIEQKPRPNYNAFEYYARGLEIMDSQPSQAFEYFMKAIELQKDYAEAYKMAGYVQGGLLYNMTDGLTYLLESERLYKKRNDVSSADYADLVMLIGGNYYNRKIYDESILYYDRTLKLYDKLGMQNSYGYASTTYGIAAALEGQGKHSEAMSHYDKADSLYKELKMTNSVAYGHLQYGIAYVYGQLHDFDRALNYYLKAREIYEAKGMMSTVIMGNLIYNIAWVYDNKLDYENAVKYYFEAYECYVRAAYEGEEKKTVYDRGTYLKEYLENK